eukprot:GDKI01027497.1.p1 GENE.GDKI01027497.1~~GDKI01027497.1.p1  ORF type:complete len:283 (-),score=63.78 GDKI01027497.1:324-1172(-)
MPGLRGEVEEASENDRLLGGRASPKTNYNALIDDENITVGNSVWTCFGCLPSLGDCCLTENERLVLQGLKNRVNIPYDDGNETHEQLLYRYWALAFPNEPKANSSSPRWKKLGFQSNNPRTDFRGGGVFSLRNMVYLAENYRHEFTRMLAESQSTDMMEYPLSAALINVSQLVVLFLQLNEEPGRVMGAGEDTASNRVLKSFARLAADANAHALEELFCACAINLHSAWKQVCQRPNANLMNFPEALRATKDAMKEVLAARPESTSEFARIYSSRGDGANAV